MSDENLAAAQKKDKEEDDKTITADKHNAATKLQAAQRGKRDRNELEEQKLAATKMQTIQRGIIARKKVAQKKDEDEDNKTITADKHNAATKLQAAQRGKRDRNELEEQKQAATKMQTIQRGIIARKNVAKKKKDDYMYDDQDWEAAPPLQPRQMQETSKGSNLQALLDLEKSLAMELELLSELNGLRSSEQSESHTGVAAAMYYHDTPTKKIQWKIGEIDPSVVDDGSMFNLPPSIGKQVESKQHRKTAPNMPIPSAKKEESCQLVFLDHMNKPMYSTYNPKNNSLPGAGQYTLGKTHYKHLKSSDKVLRFGRSAPRGLDPLDRDHRKDLMKATTAFGHGRKNPTLKRKELAIKRGPGCYNPTPVRKATKSATFGTPSALLDPLPKRGERQETGGRQVTAPPVRKSSFSISSRFTKERKLQHEKSLPELLAETRQELYYKANNLSGFVDHDSALGKQRLSVKKSAPKGLKF